jgi:hypothetical protein
MIIKEVFMPLRLDPLRTYSIFLLPFAYQPSPYDEKKSEGNEAYIWSPLDWPGTAEPSEDEVAKQKKNKRQEFVQKTRSERSPIWRLQYFMPETNMVLFNRAKWLGLTDAEGKKARTLPGSQGLHLKCGGQNSKTIALRLHWARLVLFEWPEEGVGRGNQVEFAQNGILAIKLGFDPDSKPTADHLLWLNEAFRYYKIPYFSHPEEAFRRHDVIQGLPGPSEAQSRARAYWDMWSNFLSYPVKLKEASFSLMPEKWRQSAETQAMAGGDGPSLPYFEKMLQSPITGSKGLSEHRETWDVYPDNRAFVWTCACLSSLRRRTSLPNFLDDELAPPRKNTILEFWHALLDVDSCSYPVNAFRYKWLRERTFARWQTEGTLYGFNNFSVALMAQPVDFVISHFERMYLDMGLLLLQVRTSLFRASKLVSLNTQDRLKARKKSGEKLFRDLRDDFAAFVNLYQFPLLSTQQQAIEIYTMMRKWFDVDDIFSEVKSEIESTHEHLELVADIGTQRNINALTKFGLAIAGGALAGQILGMTNISQEFFGVQSRGSFWVQSAIVAIFIALSGIFIGTLLWFKKKRS